MSVPMRTEKNRSAGFINSQAIVLPCIRDRIFYQEKYGYDVDQNYGSI